MFYIDVISSHENGCKITVECGNLESGAKNSTCYISSRYSSTVRAAIRLPIMDMFIHYSSYYGYLDYRRATSIKMFASLQYNVRYVIWGQESYSRLTLCIVE